MTRRVAVAAPEFVGTGPLPDDLGEFAALREVGVTGVELWSPWQITLDDAARVAARLTDAGLNIACISSPSYLHGHPTREGRRLLESTVEIAAAVGASVVNTYFGHGGDGDDVHAIDTYARLVGDIVARAGRLGVVIVLENEFDGFGEDPEHHDVSRRASSLRRLVDTVGDPAFRLNFDAANLRCAGTAPDDVAEAAVLLADAIGYVHVKDVVVGTSDDPEAVDWRTFSDGDARYRTVELGTGDVPWDRVLAALDSVGFAGCYTLEPHCAPSHVADQLRHAADTLRRTG